MRRASTLWLVALVGAAILVVAGCAQEKPAPTPAAEGEAAHEGMTMAQGDVMVACAYDGMVMKQQGMGAQMDYEGKAIYFCSDEEHAKFRAAPTKYLRQVDLGEEVAASLHIMPVKEYGEAMGRMGAMMKYEPKPGATHHINVAVLSEGKPLADAEITVSLTGPEGRSAKYNMGHVKALSAYGGDVAMPQRGEYDVAVEVTRGGEMTRRTFRYQP